MRLRSLTLAASVTVCGIALGHPDDPKVLDREPRYEGPGWREGFRDPPHNFAHSNVTLKAWITLPEFSSGAANGNDCWGYVSPSGREYALMGLYNGTAFVEVTDPGNPVIVSMRNGPGSLWRDIKVYQHYAYVVSEGGGGIQVFDMSQIDAGVITQLSSVLDGGTTATHNVAIDTDSGFLYRCGGVNNGLRIYDLADPANPQYVGAWNDRYVHDAMPVTYTEGPYAGRQIVFVCGGLSGGSGFTSVHILDVTDKNNIVQLSRMAYSEPGYCHQAWLSPDRQYLYVNDELDERQQGHSTRTRIIDVRNLYYPAEVGDFTSGLPAVDHNLYTIGGLILEANYRSGLRVFDAVDPRNPVEIAYFDTYPNSNSAQFNGLWSNFPYFPSGTVIGSDIERGLFIWRLPFQVTLGMPDGIPKSVSMFGDAVRVVVHEYGVGGYAGATPLLHVDLGEGFQAIPMNPLGGNEFEAVFPPAPCNTMISYYLSVQNASGATITSPFNLAQQGPYQALAEGVEVLVTNQDFEQTSGGWLVNPEGADTATDGAWTWGIPQGGVGEPAQVATPGGQRCWHTGEFGDVDGGFTTLVSAPFDLTDVEMPVISYWRWYSNHIGPNRQDDIMWIWLSNDDGATWSLVEKVGPQGIEAIGGWRFNRFVVSDVAEPTATMRMRFVARDIRGDSNVEAAIDEFRISSLVCESCPFDPSGNGVTDLEDLLIVLTNFGGNGPGDTNGDGTVGLEDLLNILANFGATCQ